MKGALNKFPSMMEKKTIIPVQNAQYHAKLAGAGYTLPSAGK